MTLIEKADQLAERAHTGQTRKDAPTPYIEHPRAVAAILKDAGFDETVVAAALVHDVVEDTPVTLKDVRQELGDEVARLVAPVTHDSTLSWRDKKLAYIEAVRTAPPEAKAIALADKIHNAESLLNAHAAQGQRVWGYFNASREDKLWFEEAMLEMLRTSWRHPLIERYGALVERLRALN